MEFKTAQQGRTFTVVPFPETDPDFSIAVKELSTSELNKIYDKHHFVPGAKDSTMSKLTRVAESVIKGSIVGVSGVSRDGSPIGADGTLSDEEKLFVAQQQVEVDGEDTSIWTLVLASIAEQKKAEAKN